MHPMMPMRKALLAVYLIVFLGSPAAAANGEEAGLFLKGKLDTVVSMLQNKRLPADLKREKAIGIMMPLFDMPLMAKLVVGKRFWPGFTEEQKTRFTLAFTHRLQKLYIEKILRYTDQKIIYKSPVFKKKNKILLPTELVSNGRTYSIDYKLYKSENGWRVYDVELENVSILKSYQTQTSRILGTQGYRHLMEKLERPVN